MLSSNDMACPYNLGLHQWPDVLKYQVGIHSSSCSLSKQRSQNSQLNVEGNNVVPMDKVKTHLVCMLHNHHPGFKNVQVPCGTYTNHILDGKASLWVYEALVFHSNKEHSYRLVGTLYNGHGVILTQGKAVNPSLSSSSQLGWVATFYLLKLHVNRLQQKSGTHIKFLTKLSPIFGRKSGNNNTRGELPHSNGY